MHTVVDVRYVMLNTLDSDLPSGLHRPRYRIIIRTHINLSSRNTGMS